MRESVTRRYQQFGNNFFHLLRITRGCRYIFWRDHLKLAVYHNLYGMAKSSNIVHQYFKKDFGDFTVLVKVNPIQFKGTEITIPKNGEPELRELDLDEEIFEDLKADGFVEASPLEFNLYLSGLV